MDYKVFNQLKVPVCIIDSGGELVYKNNTFAALMSSDKNEEGGSIALDVNHPFYNEYRRKVALSYHKVLSGSDARCFAVLKGSDSRQIPVEIYLYPMTGVSEQPRILAIFKQVDDRLVSFDGYADIDGQLVENTNLFEFSPFPIVRVDLNGEITMMSSSVELITGYSKEEILEKNSRLYEIFNSYDLERLKNAIRDIHEGYLSFKRLNDLKIVTRKNEDRFANAVLYSVISDKKVSAAEILFEDVTRISYLEKRITSMNRGNIMGDMMEGMLHTFSNIVNIVLSRSQIMMQQTEKENLLEGLRIIYDSALDGSKQIKRVLDFINETEEGDSESTDLLGLIDDAIEFARMQFKVESKHSSRDVKITRKFFVKGTITGNLRMIREIIVSMIYRIASYVGESGEIMIEIRQSSDYILSVSAAKSPERDEKALHSDIEIRRLAEKVHMRIIEEESNDRIIIKAIMPSRMISRESVEEGAPEVARLRDLDVMIVEDEEALGDILHQLFDSMGNRVLKFDDGESALKAVSERRFDLIISDYQIPGISGMDLLGRAKTKYPDTVTVLLSGWNLNIKSDEKGVDLFVPKPFQIDVLLKDIASTGFAGREDQ